MKKRRRAAAAGALLLLIGAPASAHGLDAYLQATTISVEKDRVQAEIRLTPGVAVFPAVFAGIDTNGDGVLSAAEQRSYAERVLPDLSLAVNGHRLPLRLVSWKFAATAEMKEGRGDIELDFDANVPRAGRNRRLTFQNHHQSRIATYLVNCLVSRDPDIRVTAQTRNYLQSSYTLDYVRDGGVLPGSLSVPRSLARGLGAATLVLCALLALLRRQPQRLSKAADNKTTSDFFAGAGARRK